MNFVKNLRIFLFKRRNAYLRYLCYILLSRIQGHRQGELARPYDRRTACMAFVLVEFNQHLMPYTWFP